MSILDKIAQEVSPDLPGMPWEELEEKFGMPRTELVLHVGGEGQSAETDGFFAYTQHLRDGYNRMQAVLDKCVMSFQVEDNPATSQNEVVLAVRAWDEVQNSVLSVGNVVLGALRMNVPTLDDGVTLEQEKFRAIVSSTQLMCLYGVVSHTQASMQLAQVASEDIVESADNLMKTMNGVVQLWDMGALDTLKKPTGSPPVVVQASGLGAIPAAVVIAIFATLAVGIIAWCVVAMTKQLEVNRQMKAICEDAVRRQDKFAMENCMELLKINSVSTDGGPFEAVSSLAKAVLWVGIGYLLFQIAKPVAAMLDRRRTA